MTTTQLPFGVYAVNGCRVNHVLIASTRHMPELDEDLSPWHWGEQPDYGLTWLYAYDEEVFCPGLPEWLLNLCIAARNTYGCTWVMLDPDGDVIPGLPTYDH